MSSNHDVLRKLSGLDEDEYDEQKAEWEEFIRQSGFLAGMICAFDAERAKAVFQALSEFDTLTSMLDPTFWMQTQAQAHANGKMVRILLTAKEKLMDLGICPPGA